MHRDQSIRHRGRSQAVQAFTLVELLVVFVIIAILVSSVLVASTHLIDRTRTRNTESVLKVVQGALEEFKRESPPIVKVRQKNATGQYVQYSTRYGAYPPDELEVFTEFGLPHSDPASSYSLTPKRADATPGTPGRPSVVPAPASGGSGYPPMQFYTAGNDKTELEHRDLAAMILAINLYSPSAAEMLGHLADSNWSDGAVDASGDPTQFLDIKGDKNWDAGEDEQIRYIVDSWGVPISYFAQRDFDADAVAGATRSDNYYTDWNEASTEMIRLNSGQPIVMSFGVNGKDQLSKDVLKAENSTAFIVDDWLNETDESGKRKIDNVYNEDNVYADPSLKEKLAKGTG